MPLPFEALEIAFNFIDSLSEREHVVADRVVHAFQRFDASCDAGPKSSQYAHVRLHIGVYDWSPELGVSVRANLNSIPNDVALALSPCFSGD
jgi:hypothetical protein